MILFIYITHQPKASLHKMLQGSKINSQYRWDTYASFLGETVALELTVRGTEPELKYCQNEVHNFHRE